MLCSKTLDWAYVQNSITFKILNNRMEIFCQLPSHIFSFFSQHTGIHRYIQWLISCVYNSLWRVWLLCCMYSPGCYLDEWPVRALSQVDGCTWTSDCQAPRISKLCQILDFCSRHLAECHWVALGQVVALTDVHSVSKHAFILDLYLPSHGRCLYMM